MNQVTDERRATLLTAYDAAFQGLLDAVDGLDAEAWDAPTGCPGWSVKDQLSHVVSVERRTLGDRQDRVELPDDLAHIRNDFGRVVEVGVHARRDHDPADVVAEARDTFERRLDHLRSLESAWLDEEVDTPIPGVRTRGAQLLRTRIYDVTTHEYDVRRAVGRTSVARGPHVAISTELIVRGWGRVLPGLVDGDAVLGVELDGNEVARIHLGDGQLFRGNEGPAADAVLGADAAQLLAIAGGRSDAPSLADLQVRGDVEVVRAVLAAPGITP